MARIRHGIPDEIRLAQTKESRGDLHCASGKIALKIIQSSEVHADFPASSASRVTPIRSEGFTDK